MDETPFDRRRFQQLVGAAFGGLVVGTTVGCSGDKGKGGSSGTDTVTPGIVALAGAAAPVPNSEAEEKHACRGLNACKSQGADDKNACAGQGTCANVKHHGCATQNDCKNLGGCGKTAGANECKGKGGCQVPMHSGAWETARKHFEERMKAANKKFGDAPPAPKV